MRKMAEKCVCGGRAVVEQTVKNTHPAWRYRCSDPNCWIGPAWNDQEEAEGAWDDAMMAQQKLEDTFWKRYEEHQKKSEPKTIPARTPIGIASLGEVIIAVCDDGSVFQGVRGGFWVQCVSIPGTTEGIKEGGCESCPKQ